MIIKFSDGVEFDTSGELRLEWRSDGAYVVGMGIMIPVDSREEGLKMIEDIKGPKKV